MLGGVVKAGVLKETWPGETRVALVPGVLGALAKAGIELAVEAGAGEAAGFPDGLYAEKGAAVGRRDDVLSTATLLLSVRSFAGAHDRAALERLGPQHVLVGFLDPLQQPEAVKTLAARGLTAFALELMPRITRAQSMDALSSTATMAGYKAVLLAADRLPRMFPMLMTAAGHDRAGARVRHRRGRGRAAGDRHRPAARRRGRGLRRAAGGQGAGAEPGREVRRAAARGRRRRGQGRLREGAGRGLLPPAARADREVVAESDVVITAAAVPGQQGAGAGHRPTWCEAMRPGSVIVDLAAEQGGNCEASEAGREVVAHGVA